MRDVGRLGGGNRESGVAVRRSGAASRLMPLRRLGDFR
ncbi:hypothetical protein AZ78_3058 [Lysobacter capsici AZ78]|uniref:Uncharacterized protein n=1 Tax=Lysobacter capsici AZ78 TaxID=1444315 RepID=A0A108UAE8_9GAMM|nr:hypothetical protein AZ78_3058 [Lysobacter capsici AZ78]